MDSKLVLHRGAVRMTRAELAQLPAPTVLGPIHRPVPHIELVETIARRAETAGLRLTREEYGVQHGGALLFGTMDFENGGGMRLPGHGVAMGLRASNAQQFAITVVAGQRVFVCDNLVLSGDLIALRRKHTSGLNLRAEIGGGLERYLIHVKALVDGIGRLQEQELATLEAKELAYDAFAEGIVPVRLFDDVHRNYFSPTPEMVDCQPRTKYALHNAFTRAIKALAPAPAFAATTELGRLFGLRASAN
jgi:hypothetical protein